MKLHLNPDDAGTLQRLYTAINRAEDDGLSVPCLAHFAWTVDDDQDRADYARARCQLCPVLEQCRAAARAIKPTAGVWAGRHYKPRETTTTTTKETP